MQSTIDLWVIKGTPKETLIDNIMSYKKDTMLQLAGQHQVDVKKSYTKAKITELLVPVMNEHFANALSQFTPAEKDQLMQIEAVEDIEFSQIQEFVEKGYLFVYLDKGQLKAKLPREWKEQLSRLTTESVSNSTNEFAAFYRNAANFKQIFGYINVDYLVTVWNRYYEAQLDTEEASKLLKEENILSE